MTITDVSIDLVWNDFGLDCQCVRDAMKLTLMCDDYVRLLTQVQSTSAKNSAMNTPNISKKKALIEQAQRETEVKRKILDKLITFARPTMCSFDLYAKVYSPSFKGMKIANVIKHFVETIETKFGILQVSMTNANNNTLNDNNKKKKGGNKKWTAMITRKKISQAVPKWNEEQRAELSEFFDYYQITFRRWASHWGVSEMDACDEMF